MQNNRLFITGTDTDIGKTVVTTALLYQLKQWGYTTVGCKPISAGCEVTCDSLRNDDALQLQQVATYSLPYEMVNPIAFAEPIAPMIAAQHMQQPISLAQLQHAMRPVLSTPVDYVLLEGIGGWLQPLNVKETLADYACLINANVILVVGICLGCINHSLLTWSHLQRSGVSVVGWVANCIDPDMLAQQDNINLLQELISVPCLGVIEYQDTSSCVSVASQLDHQQLAKQLQLPYVSSLISSSSRFTNVS